MKSFSNEVFSYLVKHSGVFRTSGYQGHFFKIQTVDSESYK